MTTETKADIFNYCSEDKPTNGVKAWCMTINNFTEEDEQHCRDEECSCIVFGREKTGTGVPHLQIHVRYKKTKRFGAMKKNWPTAHIEQCIETEAAWNYCLKELDYEIMDYRLPKSNEMKKVVNAIKEEEFTVREVAVEYTSTFIKYHGGIQKAIELIQQPKTEHYMTLEYWCELFKEKPFTWGNTSKVIIGASGIGKTQWAKCHFENPLMVRQMDDLRKFDRKYHDGILFDDMDFTMMTRTAQIHLLDWYDDASIHCRYNDAFIPRRTKKIFTANVYPFSDDEAIRRRLEVRFIKVATGTTGTGTGTSAGEGNTSFTRDRDLRELD